MRRAAAVLLLTPAVAGRMEGPGRGPWESATPESQGLSAAELDAAEARVNSGVGGRVCYLVVKNGKIVHETYRGEGSVTHTREGYSTTKSQCSSLYGIAREQGWATPGDRVSARNAGVRNCNGAAEFRHVLTMTGTSPDIAAPRFSYDTFGTSCLDSLSDFVAENNPDGVSTEAWKDRYWQQPLGLEHTRWSGNGLPCGSGSVISCRDLARTALLWANDGEWPGAGQLVSRAHVEEGRKWVFPQSGTDYGYTVWLSSSDPVDDERVSFNGMFSQCALASKRHNTVVVSMGMELLGEGCGGVWTHSRNAIVSKRDRAGMNLTEPTAADVPPMRAPSRDDLVLLRDNVATGRERLTPAQLAVLDKKLYSVGERPAHLPRNTTLGRNPEARGPYGVEQSTYDVPALDSTDPKVFVVWPTGGEPGQKFPMVSYAHGAAGGGLNIIGYNALFNQIASYGIIVAATRSCSFGCSDGQGYGEPYAAEQRKVIDWARQMAAAPPADMPWARALDFAHGVGIAGHSMGGQATAISARAEFQQSHGIRAAVLHQAATNAAAGAGISVPSQHMTGTQDSAANHHSIYAAAPRPKVFRNQIGEGHMEPNLLGPNNNPALGPFLAAWMHIYLLGDRGRYYDMIYGSGDRDLCHYAPMEQCELLP